MSGRTARSIVLLAWAGFFVGLWLSGEAVRYIGPRTEWVVPFGAIALSAAAVLYGIASLRAPAGKALAAREALGHAALLVPVLAVLAVPRAELGALAASRKESNRAAPVARLAEAAKGKGRIAEVSFVHIAGAEAQRSYAEAAGIGPGLRVRLLGFVTSGERTPPGTFEVARFYVSCCAADGIPVFVAVDAGARPRPPDDTWVEVTGTLTRRGARFVVRAEALTRRSAPHDPYLTIW